MATKQGLLILADISGFTQFVTETELEHGPPIIAALLEEVIRRLSPPLEIESVAGDAVYALAEDGTVEPPTKLLGILHGAFVGFHEKQRELEADDSCDCGACSNVARLRLKTIGHHGSFLVQTVGGHAQTAGRDVILAHRLLKNAVPRETDYALFTRDALDYMALAPDRLGLVSHTEHYDHFGEIPCFVGDMRCLAES